MGVPKGTAKMTSGAPVGELDNTSTLRQAPSQPMDVRKKVRSELRELRHGNSLDLVKRAAAETLPGFTVFELGSGGCLDTIAALLEGFRHLGSTEDVSKTLGQAKAKFFEDLAQARCIGDTRLLEELDPPH